MRTLVYLNSQKNNYTSKFRKTAQKEIDKNQAFFFATANCSGGRLCRKFDIAIA